jgi:hypothetical protein
VGVEKSPFSSKLPKFGDRKSLGKPRKSFVGHPDAILFLRISRERVFQHQPRNITPPRLLRHQFTVIKELAVLAVS